MRYPRSHYIGPCEIFHSVVVLFPINCSIRVYPRVVCRRHQIREKKVSHKLRSREWSSKGFSRRLLQLAAIICCSKRYKLDYPVFVCRYAVYELGVIFILYFVSVVKRETERERERGSHRATILTSIWMLIDICCKHCSVSHVRFAPQLQILLMFNRLKC